jgi:hypothetical protein
MVKVGVVLNLVFLQVGSSALFHLYKANFPCEVARNLIEQLGGTGIYYGLAVIVGQSQVYKMVASLGWNPFYRDPVPAFVILSKFIHKF